MDRLRLSAITLLILVSCVLKAQETRYFDLKNLAAAQRLQHYQVVSVVDDRYDTSTLGTLQLGFPVRKPYLINLRQGVINSFRSFIARNIKQDTQAMPVVVRIKMLKVKEVTPGLRPEISIELTTDFFIGDQRITQFNIRGTIKTMGDQLKEVGDMLSQNLQSSLSAFDDWWSKNQNLYAPTAPVTIEVIMNTTPDTARLINYSHQRPLTKADFRAKPDPKDKAIALTASSIIVKYGMIADSADLKMMVVITPFFDKSRSWFRNTDYDSTVLLHEQGHFDIAALKACELADTLRGKVFTKANCYEMVDRIQAQKKLELHDLQELYDSKTGHGVTYAIQLTWSRMIKEMLKRKSCYD
jgi:hypothetical protein